MIEINKALLDDAILKAKQSEKRRVAIDLRSTLEDNSQRMLNALAPDTIVPIHRHRKTSETVVVLSGALTENFYDDQGNIIASYRLKPNSNIVGLNIPMGQWHTVTDIEQGTVIFEAKDGKYAPSTEDDFLNTNL